MLLLALAIAPGLAICLIIYSRGKYGKEPLRYLLVSFLLGMLSTVLPLLVQFFSSDIRGDYNHHGILATAWFAFVVVGVSEETSKFLMLRLYAYPKAVFRGPFDGIVYAVMIGMGFATLENIEYVERFGMSTGISRFFLSVPAHASFAVLMGYNVGLAKLRPSSAAWLMWKGLLVAVFFHGSFDFFVFLQQNERVKQYVSEGLLSFGAFATFYIAIRLAMRTIRMQKTYDTD
ncbi:MAG TPA: PrsW family glutamic-type intramembrane protease [Puia sp.]|nr:PrsW family glutamic-type intramembrane protease [Puia sp.]